MGEPLRALLVEDSEIDAMLLIRQLRLSGYDVEVQRVDNEPDFRRALDESRWDVVLSDYAMPHLNGTIALSVLKEKNLDLPFIVVSGTLGEEAAVDLMKSGAHDFFIKGRTTRLPSAIAREIREAEHRQRQREAEQALRTRASQQAAVAEFGLRALTNTDLQTLMREAVQLMLETFEADCVRILELLADGQHVSVRVDNEGQTGVIAISHDSHVAYTLQSAHPVIVEDVASETRFSVSPAFLQCHSGISFLIRGRDKPFGVLDVFNIRHRTFTRDDLHFVQSIANILAYAIMNVQSLEAEIRAREAAEHANELKTRFLGMISHELRTPLTSIKGFLSTLLATDVEWDAEDQRRFIEIANREADNLTELIEQLLDMTRISAGTFDIKMESASVSDIVRTAISRLPQADIQAILPEALPPVIADPRRIQQVVMNLIGNAIKFSPPGHPVVINAYRDGSFVQVDIRDGGPGIPPEAREVVFEPFRQFNRDVKNRGTGLGLAIARGIINAHNGKIWIQDRPGTTVSFTLPVERFK